MSEQEVFDMMVKPLKPLIILLLALGAITYLTIWMQYRRYKRSQYYEQKKKKFKEVYSDKGAMGEYTCGQKIEKLGKTIYNAYIPANKGKTSELDITLLTKTGIYVIESKNYKAYIRGKAEEKSWTYKLGSQRGERFENPIKQNEKHIEYLRKLISNEEIPIYSIIAFADKAQIQDIHVEEQDLKVTNYSSVPIAVRKLGGKEERLDEDTIEKLYELIYPYTQVTDEVKQLHIENATRAKHHG